MTAYLIVDVHEVTDPAGMGQYAHAVADVVDRYGGRYLARGPAEVLEGESRTQRLVVLAFETMAQLHAFHEAPDYAPLKALRQRSGETTLLAVEGL